MDFANWWSCIGRKGLRLQPAQQACFQSTRKKKIVISKTVIILNIQIHSDLLNRGPHQTKPMRIEFFPMAGKTKELTTPVVKVDILTNKSLKT